MESGGWIKIYRKLLDSDSWTEEKFTKAQAWIDLIGLAKFAPGEVILRHGSVTVTLKRADMAMSVKNLAIRWKWSRGKTSRFLNCLENEHQIEQRKNNVTTVITIINYDRYQSVGTQTDTERTSEGEKRTPNGHRAGQLTGQLTAHDIRKERRFKERKEGEEGEEARAREDADADAAESDVCDNEDGDAPFCLQALNGDEWPVTNSMLVEYRGAFPDLDMVAEVRTAAQWLKSNHNPERKSARTVADMPRFLNGWLQESQRDPSRRAVALAPATGPDTDSRQNHEKLRRATRAAMTDAHIFACRLERGENVDVNEISSCLRFLIREDATTGEREEAKVLQATADEAKRKAAS